MIVTQTPRVGRFKLGDRKFNMETSVVFFKTQFFVTIPPLVTLKERPPNTPFEVLAQCLSKWFFRSRGDEL